MFRIYACCCNSVDMGKLKLYTCCHCNKRFFDDKEARYCQAGSFISASGICLFMFLLYHIFNDFAIMRCCLSSSVIGYISKCFINKIMTIPAQYGIILYTAMQGE